MTTPCGRPDEHPWHLRDVDVTTPSGKVLHLFGVCNGKSTETRARAAEGGRS